MIAPLLLVVALLLATVLLIAALGPATFTVTRRAVLPAPPAAVFAQVDDLRAWQAWSPWEKLDPRLRRAYEGPAAGVGAIYAWAGDRKVGEGRMTIVESRPGELVRLKLEFIKPFAATHVGEFTFAPADGGRATVTWSMSGRGNLPCRVVSLFLNMDRMIGRDFERGLANLGALVAPRPA